MKLQPTLAIALRQWYLARGSLTRIIPMCVWVGVDIILWGFISKYLGSITQETGRMVPIFLGAMLLWGFLVRVMQGTTMAFMEDTWSRNFLNLFATPIRISEYIAGLVISSIFTSAIGLVVMALLATTVFGLSFMTYGLAIVPFMLSIFLFGIALGIVGCAIMLRLGPAAEWFVWPIPALLSPFACVFYPLATLPHWMQLIAQAVPPSYVFEAMRGVVAGQGADYHALAVSLALDALDIVLASFTFGSVYRHALQSGLIARYSAESVS